MECVIDEEWAKKAVTLNKEQAFFSYSIVEFKGVPVNCLERTKKIPEFNILLYTAINYTWQ